MRRLHSVVLSLLLACACAWAGDAFQAHLAAVRQTLEANGLPPNAWMQGVSPPATGLDVPALRTCGGFTMRLESPHAEDALVAAGVALSAGRPSVYLVGARKDLPWFLREVDMSYPGQVAVVESSTALDSLRLHAGVSDRRSDEPHCDSFIGCLMSGLSDAQYAEARSHLQAINAALLRRKEGPTFCEGIRIATPQSFETPREALRRDLSAVRNSRRCVFYVYDAQPRPSGMWVEAGCAIGLGKPCTFLVPARACMPPCLQGGALPPGVRVVLFKSHAELLRGLMEDPARLLD